MRPLLVLLLALLPLAATAEGAAFRFRSADAGGRGEAVRALAATGAGWARTRAASEAFLGTPYVVSPLGEGTGPDPDPLLRWDGVDCLTFVETALAVGNADDIAAAAAALDDIRYRAGRAPAFEHRLHLMIAQWIPDQIAKGYLEDVTAALPGATEVAIAYDEGIWRGRGRALRALPWQEELRGTFRLPMIPLAQAQAIAQRLPEGLVLNVVRKARPDRINRVTHTGFVIVKEGKRFVRHASYGRREVVDEPIERFLGRHARMRKWEVEGINLLAVRDNAAHVRALVERRTAALDVVPAAASTR
ncbi:N-acetylmuramoyl-L-alanine amidase-like domain-containing protein [Vulgatibacter sp.]|uniref:N-acetylmuramoyl-L-alanine amidase-like domain-containing protein n=1 Tax=Vulgatibacter sp. TaxID=1971226 RepID=UPI0035679A68